jgi:large subunit ribosomal protein L18
MAKNKVEARAKRKLSIRKRIAGDEARPRLTVFRSAKHIYAQVVNDATRQTLASTSTLNEETKKELGGLKKKDQAKKVGTAIAKLCLAKGISQVVFDRNGFIYHGRVSALADAAREAGLKF